MQLNDGEASRAQGLSNPSRSSLEQVPFGSAAGALLTIFLDPGIRLWKLMIDHMANVRLDKAPTCSA